MKIRVKKTTYQVERIDTIEGNEIEYTVYYLLHKLTKKTLMHNTTDNVFTLTGKMNGRGTMTMPDHCDVEII